MIARMQKVFVAVRKADREALVAALGELGVVHLAPVEPDRAVPDDETASAVDRLSRGQQILAAAEAAGQAADVSPLEAADEALRLQREAAEKRNRLSQLHRLAEALSMWGDVRLEQFEELRQSGLDVRFYSIPKRDLDEARADFLCVIGDLPGGRVLAGVVMRAGEPYLSESSQPVPFPDRDRPTLRAEAAQIDGELKASGERLRSLAHLAPAVAKELRVMTEKGRFTAALRSAAEQGDVYALRGWVPADKADGLAGELAGMGLDVAVQLQEPEEGELPPTMLKPVWWAKPMESLFEILNTTPGYREFDVSAAFMLALPVFSAMLISDGGYGLVLLLVPVLFYRKLARAVGSQMAQLLMIIGGLTVIWGTITASFFGVGPEQMTGHGWPWHQIGTALSHLRLLSVDTSQESQSVLMRISFILGAIHLSCAHLWRAKALFPKIKFLSSIGWATFLWGVLGVVQALVLQDPFNWDTPYPYLLCIGGALAVLFAAPDRNIFKALAMGIATSIFPTISTLSDTISYVRLMAIGLAGSVLALSFNELATSAGPFLAIPILVLGHALNLALAMVALVAHGVRLNILEFSNNLGMEWSGYAYRPFARNSEEN